MPFAPLLLVLATLGTPDFELPDCRQATHRLSDHADQKLVVVVFLGTQCPLARLYTQTLNEIASRYAPSGVALVGINPNEHDTAADVAQFAREQHCRFPILRDAGNRVADQFGATRQVEVFLLDRDRQVRYHGQIDDQYRPGHAAANLRAATWWQRSKNCWPTNRSRCPKPNWPAASSTVRTSPAQAR